MVEFSNHVLQHHEWMRVTNIITTPFRTVSIDIRLFRLFDLPKQYQEVQSPPQQSKDEMIVYNNYFVT